MILVTSYENPDLDGTACSVGEAEILRSGGAEAVAALSGKLHVETQSLIKRFGLEQPEDAKKYLEDVDSIVLADASDLRGLDSALDPEKIRFVIDHRKEFDMSDFPNADFQIEPVGAAATLIVEHFQHAELEPSRDAAYLLAGAIVSNTINFQGGVTTERDRQAFQWLKTIVEISDDFARELFAPKSVFTKETLPEAIEDDFAWFPFPFGRLGIAQLELVNVDDFLSDFEQELEPALTKTFKTNEIDLGFLSIIDIDNAKNIFIASNPVAKKLLTVAFAVEWDHNRAKTRKIVMRKEIVPQLRDLISK